MRANCKLLLLICALFLNLGASMAQSDGEEVILTINDNQITKAEFERIYHKNNNNGNIADPKTVEEYMELFINFKLKVIEAQRLGLDTKESFKNELNGYVKQLAKPYLVDEDVVESLLIEAYERLKKEIKASHILIRISPNATPKDTLLAYNKAIKCRDRIIGGEDFAKVATEVSDDPSARTNGGLLGYFTAFQMVYPFEKVAYSLKVGEVSKPVKTRFGYHIIKKDDERKAQGKVQTAHIMIMTPKSMGQEDQLKAHDRIKALYKQLMDGTDFEQLAKDSSEDRSSAVKGGMLPFFSTGRMVPEFEKAAFALNKVGDISEPIKTDFGWHIIKLLEKQGIEPYHKLKSDIKSKISRDSRGNKGREAVIARLKKEYQFTDNKEVLNNLYQLVDKSVFEGSWVAPSPSSSLNATLLSFAQESRTLYDFALWISKNQRKAAEEPINNYVDSKYKEFTDEAIVSFEEKNLPQKYPEFKYLMKEYHDGILLFELTDSMVWTKAVKDSTGLEAFYKAHKNNYMWDERLEAVLVKCNNPKILKKAFKLASKGKSTDAIMAKLNKKDNTAVVIEQQQTYTKGSNLSVDKLFEAYAKDKNTKAVIADDANLLVCLNKVVAPTPKALDEVRGLVTADYQTFLEKEWIALLRKQYDIDINNAVLSTLKQ